MINLNKYLQPIGVEDRLGLPEEPEGLQSANAFTWEVDTPRMKSTTIVPEKLKTLMGGNWPLQDNKLKDVSEARAQDACSEAALERIKRKVGDIDRANDKCLTRLNVARNRLVPIVRELSLVYPQCSLLISGFFLYPKGGGYMGWHTNSGNACTRLYITHAPESDKSFFRYYCGGEYVTSWDKEGWNLRQFEVTKEDKDPLWHCVYAGVDRLSIGFRINKNLKPLK